MYIFQTCMYMYVQVYKLFDSYKHVHTMYIHVCYLFLVYIITYMYAKVCTADVLCKDGYIYFMKCTDIVIGPSEPMQNDQTCFFSNIFLKFYNIIKIII
jgi:hypothetical protein